MAEFKLTDAIDASILSNLQKISTELATVTQNADTAAAKYKELAVALGEIAKVKPENIEKLAAKLKESNGIITQMNQVQQQLTQLQTQYTTLVQQSSAVIKENTEAAKQAAQVKREEARAEQEVQKAERERIKTEQQKHSATKASAVSTKEAIELAQREVRSINEANKVNAVLRATVRALTDDEDREGKIRQQLNEAIVRNTKYVRENSDAYVKQKMNIGNYTQSIKEALANIGKGNDVVRNFGIVLKSAGGAMGAEFSAGMNTVASGIQSMIAGFVGAQAVLKLFQEAIESVKYATRTIIDFEAANSKLAAILGSTQKGIRELTDQAEMLGSTTSYTASQVTALQTELAKLGFTKVEINNSTEAVLKFAKATGSDLASAAAVAGAALRMFGADSTEMDRYVSAMAVATTKSALSFADLRTAMSTVGPVANAFGFKIEDVVTLLGKLRDSGFDASSAGTATRNIFLKMADSGGALAKALGRPITNMQELANGLLELRDRNISLAEALELTDKRSVAAFEAFIHTADTLVDLRQKVTDVTGEFDDMAATMADNVQGSIYGLQSAWEGLMLTFYNSKGVMKDVLDFLARGVRNIKYLFSDEEERQTQMNQEYYSTNKALIEGTTGIVETSKDRIRQIYKERVAAGEEAAKAEESIRAEELARLKKQGEAQTKLMEELTAKKNGMQAQLGGMGFFEKVFGNVDNALEDNVKNLQQQIAMLNFEMQKTQKLEDAITSLDLDGSDAVADVTNHPFVSEKQKKEAEKAANERAKIQAALNESIVALMDEGLEKELAAIRAAFEKKMAQYRGNSAEEIQLRLNLSLQMSEEISKKTQEYELKQAIELANIRKQAAKEGSEEAMRAELDILELKYLQEIAAANDNEEIMAALDERYEENRLAILESYASKRIRKIQEHYSMIAAMTANAMNEEIIEVQQMYAKREITESEMNGRVSMIKSKYAIQTARQTIEMLEEQLKAENLSDKERESLAEKLSAAKIKLSQEETNAIIANNKRQEDSHKKTLEGVRQVIEYVGQSLDGVSSFGNRLYQNQLDKLDEMKDALEKAYEEETERIEMLEENGSISAEEAEARKRAAKDKSERQSEKIAKRQEEIEKKQARLAKATAIAQAIMSTALAIMRVYADPGNGTFISRSAMAAIVGALGAIQLATIAATPLSAYAKGTDDAKGGVSLVGDGGKREVIMYAGKAYLTPDTPTLVDLPPHARVIPDVMTFERDFANDPSDLKLLMSHRERNGMPTLMVSNDFSSLERSNREVTDEQTRKLIRQMKINARSNYMNNYIAAKM